MGWEKRVLPKEALGRENFIFNLGRKEGLNSVRELCLSTKHCDSGFPPKKKEAGHQCP